MQIKLTIRNINTRIILRSEDNIVLGFVELLSTFSHIKSVLHGIRIYLFPLFAMDDGVALLYNSLHTDFNVFHLHPLSM